MRSQRLLAGNDDYERCVRAFRENFDYVSSTLARNGVPPADVEDLAQDVFLVMWRRWRDYDGERPLRPWLAGIARNLARARARRSGREVTRATIERVAPDAYGEDRLARTRVASAIAGVLARLPQRHREVILLHDLEEVPVREIAGRLGLPLFTVYTRLRRARLACARSLDRLRARNAAWLALWVAGAAAAVVLGWLALRSSPRPPPRPVDRGIIGYWRFDEPGDADLSGNANACTLHGPQLDRPPGRLGKAIALDGQGWLECPGAAPFAHLGETLSISVWVKPSHVARGLQSLVARQLDDGRLDRFYLALDGGRQAVVFSSHLFEGMLRYPFQDPQGWVHLAAVHAPGLSTLYVDGREVMRRNTSPAELGGGDTPLIIGGAMNLPPGHSAEERFTGALDELVIYDRALSDAEVAALAAGVQPSPPPR